MKRWISLLLAAVLIVGMCPIPAQAQQNQGMANITNDQVTVDAATGFGTLLGQDISQYLQNSAEEEAKYDIGCSVAELEVEGNTATVAYSASQDAVLFVALYTEDGGELFTSAFTQVKAGEGTATVTFEGDMPEYFLASAYLMDTYDLSPLCAAYETPMYTEDMQQLLTSTVDDYDPYHVLNLDDDDTTNFAVFSYWTVVIEGDDSTNIVSVADYENNRYVIRNADEQITELMAGDIFAYPYAENELLIVKIESIDIKGTTATIIGGDLEMADAFDYVKIEAADSTENLVVDDSTADEGVTYLGMSGPANTYGRRSDDQEVGVEFSHSLKYKIEDDIVSKKNGSVKVSGSLEFSLKAELSYYISPWRQYVDFRIEDSITGTITISGELEHKWKLCDASFVPVPGVSIGLKPTIKLAAECEIEFSLALTGMIGFRYDDSHGLMPIISPPHFDPDIKLEGKISLTFDLQPNIQLAGGLLGEFKLELPIGFEAKITRAGNGGSQPSGNALEYHTCVRCLDVEIFFVAAVKTKLEFLKCDKLTIERTLLQEKDGLGHAYFSIDHLEAGWGLCPYLAHRLTVLVTDANGNPIPGANVNDGRNTVQTNGNGIAVFYLPEGAYDIKAASGKLENTESVWLRYARRLVIQLQEKPKNTTPIGGILNRIPDDSRDHGGVLASGNCGVHGNNVIWTLYNDGLLTISGKGAMKFYDIDEAPWDYFLESIKEIVVKDGVTTISACAFANCINVRSITIGNSIGSIGDSAFYECIRLSKLNVSKDNPYYSTDDRGVLFDKNKTRLIKAPRTISGTYSIPDGVTVIAEYAFGSCSNLSGAIISDTVTTICDEAFYGCEHLSNVTIGNGVTSIGYMSFAFCTKLTTIRIPNSVRTIDVAAFYGCDNLTNITIGSGITYIGVGAFTNFWEDEKLVNIYYSGSESQWNRVNIEADLTYFIIHYNSTGTARTAAPPQVLSVPANEAVPSADDLPMADPPTYAAVIRPADLSHSYFRQSVASFTNLVPGAPYIFLDMKSIDVENPLELDNLLYITQAEADENGNLVVKYFPRENTDNYHVLVCGASNRNLNDAVISLPAMNASTELQAVNPTVFYDGNVLEEGLDYEITGTVSFTDAGTYTCYIRGIHNYTGTVECTYTVEGSTVVYGDTNGDSKVNGLDLILLRQHLAGWDVELDTASADVNGNGAINGLDLILLRQHLAGWDVTLGPQ